MGGQAPGEVKHVQVIQFADAVIPSEDVEPMLIHHLPQQHLSETTRRRGGPGKGGVLTMVQWARPEGGMPPDSNTRHSIRAASRRYTSFMNCGPFVPPKMYI